MRAKVVWTPSGTGIKLASAFKCTTKAVTEALNGKKDSEMSRKIRYVAIKEYGGVAVRHYPETSHDTINKTMTQVFGDRVKLIADFKAGCVGVYIDGELKSVHHPVSIEDFMLLQNNVREISETI